MLRRSFGLLARKILMKILMRMLLRILMRIPSLILNRIHIEEKRFNVKIVKRINFLADSY